MEDADREVVRRKVRADNEKLMAGLAPLYLGKTCPLSQTSPRQECNGPECGMWQTQAERDERGNTVIAGGGCSVSVGVAILGPIAGGLFQMASALNQSAADNGPKIVAPPPGLLR